MAVGLMMMAMENTKADERRNIVLVHGAWGGGFTYEPVTEILRSQGHNVFVPDLTGHGARKEEGGPHVSLEDHVMDVVGVVEDNALSDVTLVCHSNGGVPGTLAWERLGEKISHFVYLDSFAPIDESANPLDYFRKRNTEGAPYKVVDGMIAPPPPNTDNPVFAPQSVKTLTDDMSLQSGSLPEHSTRTFVWASRNTLPNGGGFRMIRDKLSENPRWMLYSVPTDHYVMLEDPVVAAAIVASR